MLLDATKIDLCAVPIDDVIDAYVNVETFWDYSGRAAVTYHREYAYNFQAFLPNTLRVPVPMASRASCLEKFQRLELGETCSVECGLLASYWLCAPKQIVVDTLAKQIADTTCLFSLGIAIRMLVAWNCLIAPSQLDETIAKLLSRESEKTERQVFEEIRFGKEDIELKKVGGPEISEDSFWFHIERGLSVNCVRELHSTRAKRATGLLGFINFLYDFFENSNCREESQAVTLLASEYLSSNEDLGSLSFLLGKIESKIESGHYQTANFLVHLFLAISGLKYIPRSLLYDATQFEDIDGLRKCVFGSENGERSSY